MNDLERFFARCREATREKWNDLRVAHWILTDPDWQPGMKFREIEVNHERK